MNNRSEAQGGRRGGRSFNNRGPGRGNPSAGRHSPSTDGRPPHRHSPKQWAGAGTHAPFSDAYSGNKEFQINSDMENPQPTLPMNVSKHSEHKPTFSSTYGQEWRPSGKKDTFSHAERLKEGQNSNESVGVDSKGHLPSLSTVNHSENLHVGVDKMKMGETTNKMKGYIKTSPSCKSEAGYGPVSVSSPLNTTGPQKPELSEQSELLSNFDLCPTKAGNTITLKAPLLVQNRERRNEIKRSMEQKKGSVLQSGMVLLKGYISPNDQANIVKLCQNLGRGPGGFYQPGYRDGAKLNLKMMCLGKNWDPETSNYGDYRPIDGAKPPTIPKEFFQLVESAIKESDSVMRKDSKDTSSECILPRMSPDICLVNFYSSSGRLGLHQDRDESEESLHKGLPVVSFSIGDTAEFLYGDQRDVEKANKVLLESGDVLIFGGKSRHVFHGVASIQPNTAPKTLLEKTNMRPGRLNLTFREY